MKLWRKWREGDRLIYLVFFLSIIYLGFVASSIHEGIFYAGDEGIKSLVVKQIAHGYGFKYLHLSQPGWVQSIWQAGFSPLRRPTFYKSANGYEIVFPPAFQIVSAWLYERFGTVGLYIIPMSSTLILLLWLAFLLKRNGVKPMMAALALFILVFCSPLALYGVMFWEHLPAVLLLFAGLAFIVRPARKPWAAATLGFVSGLAVFLRPEAIMMDLLYGIGVLWLYFRDRRFTGEQKFFGTSPRTAFVFLGGMAVPALIFAGFNLHEYGSILGLHARQVFDDNNPDTRMTLHHGLQNLWQNNYISTRHFLFVLLLIPLLLRAVIKRNNVADPRPVLLALIVVAFSLFTPWVLPNNGIVQWGARYFLAIIPVTLVALFLAERNQNWLTGRRIPLGMLGVVVVFICYCFYHNTHGGGYKEVRWRNNQRLTKTYQLIDSQPGNVVIVSGHWMINDFAYLFDKDYFFAASGNDSLRRLLPLLREHGVHHYIFVYDPRVPSLPTMLRDSSTSHWWTERAHNVYVKNDYDSKLYTLN